MMYELVIKADTNDGDYITQASKLTRSELEALKPILEVIKAHHGRWETGDIGDTSELYKPELTSEQIEWFDNLVPFGEFGVHTIESAVVYPLPEKTILYSRWD